MTQSKACCNLANRARCGANRDGRALQFSGINFIIPTDAKIQSDRDLAGEAVSIQDVIDAMKQAKISGSIVLLDACRDNPFADAARLGSGATR